MSAPSIPSHANKGLKLIGLTERANAAADIGTSVPATRLLELVNLLPHPPSAGLTLLDNACGNLNLSYQFLRRWDGQNGLKEVKAGDNSQEMITHAQNRLKKGELKGLAIDLREWDAHNLPLDDASVDYALMNFGPQLMKDADQALKEMYRVLKPGGHLGFTAWDKTGWPRGLHGAGIKFPVPLTSVWTEEAYIKKFLGGEYFSFADVHVENLAFETVHEDVEGFLELMNVLLGNKLKEGDFDKYCEFVRKDSAEEGKKGWEGKWQATIVVATKSQ